MNPRALEDPRSCFGTPAAVLLDRVLTRAEKIQVLHRWEYDARLLEVAQEENMVGSAPSLLSDILDALHALGSGGCSSAPTKQGGAPRGASSDEPTQEEPQ